MFTFFGPKKKKEKKNPRLGRGLVFDDEIAPQQRMDIRRNFGSGRGSEAAGNLGAAPGQFRGSGSLSRAG